MLAKPIVEVFRSSEELAHAAAEKFIHCSRRAENPNRFSVLLSGGKTPARIYELLASNGYKERINWEGTHFFFGDERVVPWNHPDSNYGMVYRTLFSRLPIPVQNIHRIIGEGNPKKRTKTYEEELKNFFHGQRWPRFDLIFLGMGADGHTASLFPGSRSSKVISHWVTIAKKPKPAELRITVTMPVINNGRHVVFLVTGREKAQRLKEVLRSEEFPRYPAQLVKPVDGTLEWLVDDDAASLLDSGNCNQQCT